MDIKIFVCCHKKFNVLENPYLYPIQVGAYFNKSIKGFINDFAGGGVENISCKNKRYCELTAQYFVWKNVDADYYGFFHYRRYLSFSDKEYKTKITCEVVAKNLDDDFAQKFGYANLAKVVKDYDILLPQPSFAPFNIHSHYKLSCMQDIRDLDFCIDYIKKNYPDMTKAAKKYLRQHRGYFCNMFIMKKEIFHSYCKWLFEILDAHEKFNDHENSDVQTYRVSGYLSERLLGIYITYLKQIKKYRIKELQTIKIENAEIIQPLKKECENVIVLPIDEKSHLKASVLLQSIVENVKQKTQVILAYKGVSNTIINALKKQAGEKTIINTLPLTNSINSYHEFIMSLPKLLANFEKVIVLKPYAIALNDVTCTLTKTIAGSRDVDYEIYAKKYPKKAMVNYICDARLEIDLKKLEKLSKDVKSYQELLLALPQEEIQILNQNNLLKFDSLGLKIKEVNAYCAHGLFEEFIKARKEPQLISFEGKVGPLKDMTCEYGAEYYKFARKSPFYELILKQLMTAKLDAKEKRFIKKRKRLDKFAPPGSDKRLALRTISKKYY